MSPVGHSLTGLAILAAVLPSRSLKRPLFLFGTASTFVLFANIPDLPLPNWGHDRYDISHSIFSTTLGVICLVCLYRAWLNGKAKPQLHGHLIYFGAFAWYSHLLLDSFYNHGRGIGVMWPLGEGRLNLPLPWFETLRIYSKNDILSPHSLRIYATEGIAYGIVLLAIITLRFWLHIKARTEKI